MNGALRKGTFCSVVSALVFGFTPVLASITFDMGSNAMTLTFYRNALAVPVLLVILLLRKVDLRIGLKDFLVLAAVSAVFSATTTYILYDAYEYIGVGLSTTLHFLYPVFTVLFGWVLFKKKPDKARIFALILATAGIALATGEGGGFCGKGNRTCCGFCSDLCGISSGNRAYCRRKDGFDEIHVLYVHC